jgi:TrwC relaxase
VKSVSTLWAVAGPAVAAAIERAHQAAVRDSLVLIEEHALFTRSGPQGIRQVNVRGLVAAAFTHRDSRAGDPDLHTHVAVVSQRHASWRVDLDLRDVLLSVPRVTRVPTDNVVDGRLDRVPRSHHSCRSFTHQSIVPPVDRVADATSIGGFTSRRSASA